MRMQIEKVWMNGIAKDQYISTVSIILADGPMRFCLKGMRLLMLGDKMKLAMPSLKKMDDMGNPRYEDIFNPMNQLARDFMEREIFAHYEAQNP